MLELADERQALIREAAALERGRLRRQPARRELHQRPAAVVGADLRVDIQATEHASGGALAVGQLRQRSSEQLRDVRAGDDVSPVDGHREPLAAGVPLERPEHAGVQRPVRDLNHLLRQEPALYEQDFEPAGFWWLESNDAASNAFAFARASRGGRRLLVCTANLSPVPRERYRLGLPRSGRWIEALNTDSARYGGSNLGNPNGIEAEPIPWHGQDASAEVTLPPLAVIWLVPAV